MNKKPKAYLGIDVGSISTNFAVIDSEYNLIKKLYLRTNGDPINAIKKGMEESSELEKKVEIEGVGTTGSARKLAGLMVGADTIRTEITAHATASSQYLPDVRTIFEIGGQDSKVILIRNGCQYDFAMNTVCAAGCGAFLDHQSNRLKIPIENFGELALQHKTEVDIAGRCTVFAESDMIHKQQAGYKTADILYGLCKALVRNYLSNVCKGKDMEQPIMLQGGVAANIGVRKAFEEELKAKVIVPEHFDVMGAKGIAILTEKEKKQGEKTKFKGFDLVRTDFKTDSYTCSRCENRCELTEAKEADKIIARWGSRCGKYNL